MPTSERRVILIDGKSLWNCSIAEIMEGATRPTRTPWHLGDRHDYWQNCRVLEAFGDQEVAVVDDLIENFRAARQAMREDFTLTFDCLRLAEALQWGAKHGIVERVFGARPEPQWRLLVRERQFECVGPAARQVAIRVRGLQGPEGVAAAKLWDRELKRREKARLKAVAKAKPGMMRIIAAICRRAPETILTDYMAKFTVGEFVTVEQCRFVIEDAIDGMGEVEVGIVDRALEKIFNSLPEAPRPAPVVADALALDHVHFDL